MSQYPHKKYSEDTIKTVVPTRRKSSRKLITKSSSSVVHTIKRKQSKSDLANDGIDLDYNEKEHNKSQQQFTIEHNLIAQQINTEQALLQLLLKRKPGQYLSEEIFNQKAMEVLNTLHVNTNKIDEWLQMFKRKHKIATFVSGIQCTIESKEEWMQFMSNFKSSDVYFAGMFALSHNQDAKNYFNENSSDNYVSIMFVVNTSGSDKQRVAVIGKETFDVKACIKSLPVKYYQSSTKSPQINFSMISTYLENWDSLLSKMEKSILLIVDMPEDLLIKLKFENIKLLNTRNFNYLSHVLDKLIECFKFNYRKLQISCKSLNDHCPLQDYLWLIAMAWHNVPYLYIQLLSSPEADSCLYFNINDDNYGDHSLSHWYKMKNIPSDLYLCSDINKLINCDNNIQCVNWRVVDGAIDTDFMNTSTDKSNESISSFEAYQAMQRLVSYLQEQNAGLLINQAKLLENYIEYKALSQIHDISTNK